MGWIITGCGLDVCLFFFILRGRERNVLLVNRARMIYVLVECATMFAIFMGEILYESRDLILEIEAKSVSANLLVFDEDSVDIYIYICRAGLVYVYSTFQVSIHKFA